ncbi:Lar family restriction alleviation protein [Dyadobacter psychrotolerans]|uniref:Restriction alleviation protein, Lar family n=1 Tax=Dyadobacter psychrotolerans TaxID=2541721 RepID=A0A4R5DY97_9BACT|nr:Lar family restriction alleviation protein [Dyadobacter psychrotolerans]TDE17694.1 restriction alleviation protein, Lar family [Dyadobacter psychrotolerans]
MTDKPDLLPCPFCGGGSMIIEPYDNSSKYVLCQGCSAMGSIKDTVEETIAAWNTRTAAPLPEDKQKALDWWNEFTDGGAGPHDETIRASLQTPSESDNAALQSVIDQLQKQADALAEALRYVPDPAFYSESVLNKDLTVWFEKTRREALANYNKFKQGE